MSIKVIKGEMRLISRGSSTRGIKIVKGFGGRGAVNIANIYQLIKTSDLNSSLMRDGERSCELK